MSKSIAPTIDQVAAILNHDRTRVAWVCSVVDGKIAKIARILTRYPRDGAGRLTVCVSDWGPTGHMDPDECARIILESVKVGDTRTARDAAIMLLEWLGRGGFKPDAALCAELGKIARAQGHVNRVIRAVTS